MELALPARPDSVRTARSAVDELEISPAIREDVRLLISELVTNSIRHGELGPDQRIRVRFDVTPAMARVEVTDAGIGFGVRPPERAEPGGWGLMLTDTLASRWGISSDGGPTRVWFEKELRDG